MGGFNYWHPTRFCGEIHILSLPKWIVPLMAAVVCFLWGKKQLTLTPGHRSGLALWPPAPSLALLPFSLILCISNWPPPLWVLPLRSEVSSDSYLPHGQLAHIHQSSPASQEGDGVGGCRGWLPWRPLPVPAQPRLLELSGHV